jgi:hypothetical protein
METLGADVVLVVLADHHTVVFDFNNNVCNGGTAIPSIVCDRINHTFYKKTI